MPSARLVDRPVSRLVQTDSVSLVASAAAPDHGQLRLAELVAVLSLGIDLGFGQPMEHVLRQCLIALRLAERVGVGEAERAVVYYTAMLVNVGCHTDAHESARTTTRKAGSPHAPRADDDH